MSGPAVAWEVAMLLLGGTGSFEGLFRLATTPLTGVLIIVSAMFFLLFPVAKLCGASYRQWPPREK